MAGKPAAAGRKQPAKKNEDHSFPGLKPLGGTGPGAPISQYGERQRDEVMALEAIYGEDFVQHKAAYSAWKKSEPSFDIHIKASDEDFAVTLGVVLTATYPKSPPLLTLRDHGNLRGSTLFKVQKYAETQPRKFADE